MKKQPWVRSVVWNRRRVVRRGALERGARSHWMMISIEEDGRTTEPFEHASKSNRVSSLLKWIDRGVGTCRTVHGPTFPPFGGLGARARVSVPRRDWGVGIWDREYPGGVGMWDREFPASPRFRTGFRGGSGGANDQIWLGKKPASRGPILTGTRGPCTCVTVTALAVPDPSCQPIGALQDVIRFVRLARPRPPLLPPPTPRPPPTSWSK